MAVERYLLKEDGGFLLTEDGFYLILDEYSYIVSTVSGTEDVHGNFYYPDGDIQIVGPYGDTLFTNDPGTDVYGAFGYAVADFVLYGVVNGAFSQGPPFGTGVSIGSNNPMPYWTGPWVVSGSSIDGSWVTDAASPSGHNFRFTIAAGAAGDEVYIEQIVPIGGDRLRRFAAYPRGVLYRVTASGGIPRGTIAFQYLTASGATIGSEITDTADLTSNATVYGINATVVMGPPADAHFLRLRFGVRRNTMATTDTATIDLVDVRIDRAGNSVLIAEQTDGTTYGPGFLYQAGGSIFLNPALFSHGNTWVHLDAAASAIGLVTNSTQQLRVSANTVQVQNACLQIGEQSAPGTPASGYGALYVSTDGRLRFINDAGTDTAITP